MQAVLQSVDPRLPFSGFHSMEELQRDSIARQRYEAVIFSLFAGLALLLSAIGIYGLVANSVAQRTREMSIRIALGAGPRDLLANIIRSGMRLAIAGIAAGLVLFWYASRLLEGLIWGVPSRDLESYLSGAIVMFLTALAATILPALRVLKLDPAQTLHEE
jgi:ABC-type antimicrobial peptide transport system permease subunit